MFRNEIIPIGAYTNRDKLQKTLIGTNLSRLSGVDCFCKQKFADGIYTPNEYIDTLQSTSLYSKPICSLNYEDILSDFEESEDDLSMQKVSTTHDVCCVCLQQSETTICFRPCSHPKVCFRCDKILIELSQTFRFAEAKFKIDLLYINSLSCFITSIHTLPNDY